MAKARIQSTNTSNYLPSLIVAILLIIVGVTIFDQANRIFFGDSISLILKTIGIVFSVIGVFSFVKKMW